MGGLGNQMFQYAAGRALALRLGAELRLDLSWFASTAKRLFMLNAFPNINVPVATEQEIESLAYAPCGLFCRLLRRRQYAKNYVAEPHYAYWDGFRKIIAPAYLSGYWQNELYFKDVTDTIRWDFTFPSLPKDTAEITDRIQVPNNVVAVHIRRGDYTSNSETNQIHGLCSPEYYCKALKTVADRVTCELELFLFTDDPVWVRENFDTQGMSATVMDFPDHITSPWHDLHLMLLCKHHIIANSSFSWWGAWLSEGNGMTIAPKQWFAEKSLTQNSPVPMSWITL